VAIQPADVRESVFGEKGRAGGLIAIICSPEARMNRGGSVLGFTLAPFRRLGVPRSVHTGCHEPEQRHSREYAAIRRPDLFRISRTLRGPDLGHVVQCRRPSGRPAPRSPSATTLCFAKNSRKRSALASAPFHRPQRAPPPSSVLASTARGPPSICARRAGVKKASTSLSRCASSQNSPPMLMSCVWAVMLRHTSGGACRSVLHPFPRRLTASPAH